MSTEKLDFSDAATKARIWDTNGDFKNPGEDGSLYFSDTYGSVQPEIYLLDGSGRYDNGSVGYVWVGPGSGASDQIPGGLKKQYINADIADWEYKNLTTAESSGDAWLNGDTVRAGPTIFVYMSTLATSGHSGLIHKDPVVDGSTVSDATVGEEEAVGTDPDTWAGSNNSTGTQGVDYDFDTNGGKARFINLTGSGKFLYGSYNGGIGGNVNEISFAVFDAIRVTHTSTTLIIEIGLRHFIDSSDYAEAKLGIKTETSSTKWSWLEGAPLWVPTKIPFGTPTRIWMYVKAGRATVYADEKISQLDVSNDIRSPITGAPPQSLYFIGASSAGKDVNCELGYHIVGGLTL